MQVTIYIPKKYEVDYEEAKKAAEKATETGGVGAYFIKLHRESKSKTKAQK